MTSVKIYGYGWVGNAMRSMFPNALVVDPAVGRNENTICDVAFVCVPTPLKGRELDCSVVEDVVLHAHEPLIIVRSTVMPGTCDRLTGQGKRVVFQPEYLGETVAHPMTNQLERNFMILGGHPEDRAAVIRLYQSVFNANITIRQVSNYEAEVIKLSENRAIAFKIAQCQELYDVCELAGLDYNSIREAVYGDDPRFNLWHTFVYPEKRGFSSKCLPKDVYAWASFAESLGYTPTLTSAMLSVNEQYIGR